jgi:hypothetical protein
MTYTVLRPFAGHQVGISLPDLVGHNADYLIAAGFVAVDDDTNDEEKPARTMTKKRKD